MWFSAATASRIGRAPQRRAASKAIDWASRIRFQKCDAPAPKFVVFKARANDALARKAKPGNGGGNPAGKARAKSAARASRDDALLQAMGALTKALSTQQSAAVSITSAAAGASQPPAGATDTSGPEESKARMEERGKLRKDIDSLREMGIPEDSDFLLAKVARWEELGRQRPLPTQLQDLERRHARAKGQLAALERSVKDAEAIIEEQTK